jgi:PIN domain nuclease of toxin-antitoxin system
LSARATSSINDSAAVLHVSHASLWEIILKHGAGKLTLPDPPRKWWTDQVARWGLTELPLTAEALFRGSELPPHHKDPFDRVILGQAEMHGFQVVSPDSEFPAYGIPLVW